MAVLLASASLSASLYPVLNASLTVIPDALNMLGLLLGYIEQQKNNLTHESFSKEEVQSVALGILQLTVAKSWYAWSLFLEVIASRGSPQASPSEHGQKGMSK